MIKHYFSQVREAKRINARLQESSITSDEFTQRLSSMEKKLQQVSLERDKLRSENEVRGCEMLSLKRVDFDLIHGMLQKLKKEAASRMSKAQVDEILAEKDEEIRDLRTEGENLSKQVRPFFKVHFGSLSIFGPVCKRRCYRLENRRKYLAS